MSVAISPNISDQAKRQEELAQQRFVQRIAAREKNLLNLQIKTPFEVDTPERGVSRKMLMDPKDEFALERIIGDNDLFPINFLEKGLVAGKSVCRIVINDGSGHTGYGTGFLVTPFLLLTNNHVLTDAETARLSYAQFNYELDLDSKERVVQEFRFAPDVLFLTNPELDYTLISVQEKSSSGTDIQEFGHFSLIKQTGKALIGEYVSIIQHPRGERKAVVLRENKIVDVFDHFIHYSADTCEGSSGSVVCNDNWEVIALHHAGVPDPNHSGKFIANEGVRISSIVDDVGQNLSALNEQQRMLVKELANDIQALPQADEMRVAEDFSLEWYADSVGHEPNFLGDAYMIPHPKLRSDLAGDVVNLMDGGKVLNYTHFSVVMSKTRRLAFYTVVDIDGNQLKDERRDDDWRYDPRIDRKFQCGNELYSHNPLDRGHLVRRRDPVWGAKSSEANQDTFHFTNCSPQHESFNQKTNLWLGLEDYLLNHTKNPPRKAIVFTGPVFREDDKVYRGVKLPAEYWKIAVFIKDTGEMSATAYLVSQKELIRNLEADVPGAFKTFQVKVSMIEALTGLDFGALRNQDPLEREEATIGQVINQLEDIHF